jgi:phospholipid/cholesterol/gamma-HCH transport system permease protein
MTWLINLGGSTLNRLEMFGRATLMLFGAIVAKPQPLKMIPLLR